jgi:hypothetical protein
VSASGVALFRTSSAVMRAEKLITKGGVTVRLIPTPREFSNDCGMAVRFDLRDEAAVRALLQQSNLEVAGIHAMGS